jgi:hypothetical protein
VCILPVFGSNFPVDRWLELNKAKNRSAKLGVLLVFAMNFYPVQPSIDQEVRLVATSIAHKQVDVTTHEQGSVFVVRGQQVSDFVQECRVLTLARVDLDEDLPGPSSGHSIAPPRKL